MHCAQMESTDAVMAKREGKANELLCVALQRKGAMCGSGFSVFAGVMLFAGGHCG